MPAFLTNLMIDFSHWLRPWMPQLCMAVIASLLVIYGNNINRAVKQLVQGSHFIIRTAVFVLLCAVGYGMATVLLAPLLLKLLFSFGAQWYGLVIVLIFIVIGMLAQKHNYQ
ncbi:DUF3392 family protein [Gynuella sp.]|uniref:DUF3392 family protein n=1 Tax=Gynuella sp. TaxID=2969146 RepID=UPI003D0CCFAA